MEGVCWRVLEIQLGEHSELDLESTWVIQTRFADLGELQLEPRR